MLSHIPQVRLLIYFLIAGLLPTLFTVAYLWHSKSNLDSIEERIDNVRELVLVRDTKQAANGAVINHYRHSDNFYIDKQLEKLHFLEPEMEGLQRILTNKNFADDEEARRRLDFLSGPSNTLTFNEGAVVRYPLFREVVETQARPVEVDLRDIQRILTLIEGVSIGGVEVPPGRPQLIVLDFRIDKKKIAEDNEVFLLNTRLLKREYP
jgi:hypothetical protein